MKKANLQTEQQQLQKKGRTILGGMALVSAVYIAILFIIDISGGYGISMGTLFRVFVLSLITTIIGKGANWARYGWAAFTAYIIIVGIIAFTIFDIPLSAGFIILTLLDVAFFVSTSIMLFTNKAINEHMAYAQEENKKAKDARIAKK